MRVVSLVGEGAFARVYLAEHPVLHQRFALKVLHPRYGLNPEILQRFVGEARATNAVRHDNVVQVFDINVDDPSRCFIVMEFLEGRTLESMLRAPMSFADAAPLLVQVCSALEAAHQGGVVHRDLKPENLFVLQRARPHVKIVDFGIARRQTLGVGESRTALGTIVGTPQYMAPEQAFAGAVDGRADIYSLGAVMFRMLTGRLPFEDAAIPTLLVSHASRPPPAPSKRLPGIPPEVDAIVLRALAKKPEDRFGSMQEFGRAIGEAEEALAARGFTGGAAATAGPAVRAPATLTGDTLTGGTLGGGTASGVRAPLLMAELLTGAGEPLRGAIIALDPTGATLALADPPPGVGARVRLRPLTAAPLLVEAEVTGVLEGQGDGARSLPRLELAFLPGGEGQAAAVRALMKFAPAGASRPQDPRSRLFAQLERIERAEEDDPYGRLGISADSDFDTVRGAAERLARELDALTAASDLSDHERTRVDLARYRVGEAEERLIDPGRRAWSDAARGNFVGVARCMEAGLDTARMDDLRQRYVELWPQRGARLEALFAQLREVGPQGDEATVLRLLTEALRLDPLNVHLHEHYWRRLK